MSGVMIVLPLALMAVCLVMAVQLAMHDSSSGAFKFRLSKSIGVILSLAIFALWMISLIEAIV